MRALDHERRTQRDFRVSKVRAAQLTRTLGAGRTGHIVVQPCSWSWDQTGAGPPRGAAEIGARVGNRYKVAKHFVTDAPFAFHRDDAGIANEQQLDGIYIVRSNVEPEQFDAAQTVRAYKDLSKVERASVPQVGGPEGAADPPPSG